MRAVAITQMWGAANHDLAESTSCRRPLDSLMRHALALLILLIALAVAVSCAAAALLRVRVEYRQRQRNLLLAKVPGRLER